VSEAAHSDTAARRQRDVTVTSSVNKSDSELNASQQQHSQLMQSFQAAAAAAAAAVPVSLMTAYSGEPVTDDRTEHDISAQRLSNV